MTTWPGTDGIRVAGVPARRIGKDVKMGDPAVRDEVERLLGLILGFGRETRDKIGADRHLGPKAADLTAERNRVGSAMPPLHALEDQVGAALQRTDADAA